MKKKNATPATESATSTETPEVVTGNIVKAPEAPLTVSLALDTFVKSESPADSRQFREVTEFVQSHILSAQQNLLDIGERLNQLRNDIGAAKFWQYCREVLVKAKLTSEGSISLWMGRATILRTAIPSEPVRHALLASGNGQNIVVRIEPSEDEKKAGQKASYQLSPFVAEAMKQLPMPKGKLNTEHAEKYVQQLISVSSQLRSKARTPDSDRDAANARTRIVKQFTAYQTRFGTGASGAILKQLFAIYCAKAKQKDAEILVGSFDKVFEAAAQSGMNGDTATEPAKPAKAAVSKAA